MKIGLFGHGKMGTLIEQMAVEQGDVVVSPAEAEVCIDFSHPDVALQHIAWSIEHEIPLVIGTTGWDHHRSDAEKMVEEGQKNGVIASPNFSLGVAIFIHLLKQASTLLSNYDVAGVEFHHAEKKDAPSGTAIAIAEILGMKNPFASVRCGRNPGKHLLTFDSPSDSITLIHEAHNRKGFAQGALKAASWIRGKKGWYTLETMLRDLYSAHYPF
jgi:4-hydroxy-tetrahydrodipicolinate reductase